MSVVVVIDLVALDGHLDLLIEQLHKILPDTRAYDRCLFLKMAVYEGKPFNKIFSFRVKFSP